MLSKTGCMQTLSQHLTFPLLSLSFWLAAARRGMRGNKPNSFPCLLKHQTYFIVCHLKWKYISFPTAFLTYFSQKILQNRTAMWPSSYRKGETGRGRRMAALKACKSFSCNEPLQLISLSMARHSKAWIQCCIFWEPLWDTYLVNTFFTVISQRYTWNIEN